MQTLKTAKSWDAWYFYSLVVDGDGSYHNMLLLRMLENSFSLSTNTLIGVCVCIYIYIYLVANVTAVADWIWQCPSVQHFAVYVIFNSSDHINYELLISCVGISGTKKNGQKEGC
jgi:hypothetical protein